MKAGDLVAKDHFRSDPDTVGIVVDSKIIRNRIAVLWPNKGGEVVYEPITFLEVISESR